MVAFSVDPGMVAFSVDPGMLISFEYMDCKPRATFHHNTVTGR